MYHQLTALQRAALIGLLRRAIDEARYPLAPRLDPLKAILAKLEPPPMPRRRRAGIGPPMTLSNAAAAKVRLRFRLVVTYVASEADDWCRTNY
jgi:hypothetical protein